MGIIPSLSEAINETAHLAKEPLEYHNLKIFGFEVHGDTVLVTFFWMVLVALVLALIFRKSISYIPGRLQSALELFIGFFDDIATGLCGPKMRKYLPFLLTFFIFIATCNLIGLIPPIFKIKGIAMTTTPTRDLNTTFALAAVAFLSFQFIGYKEHGISYLKHYLHPLPEFLPILPKWSYPLVLPLLSIFFIILNIIEELSRVLSLTMRLMGNILGEHIVASVMLGLVLIAFSMSPLGILANVMPFLLQFIGCLASVIQAFVFTLLTMSYVASAIEH